MHMPIRQRGISIPALLAILLIVAFVVMIAVRLTPVYFDYYTLVSVVKSVQQDQDLRNESTDEVRSALDKRMRLNEIDDLGYDVVAVKRPGGGLALDIAYEVRRPFIGNIDMVVYFNRRIGP